jgi:hypothetical protein
MMITLHRFLVDYDMAMLRALAENLGMALETNRQTDAADQLAVALAEPSSVQIALARLSRDGRSALDTLLAAGGRMRAPQFNRQFGQVRPVGPGRLEREFAWRHPANPAEELYYVGLIYRAFYQDERGPGEFVLIPDELRCLLPQPPAAPPAFVVTTVPGPSEPSAQESTLVHDLFLYLVHVQNHDVRPYADGRLGQRDRSALVQQLRQPAERRLALVHHLVERLGFVARRGDLLRLEPAVVKGWLTAAPIRQLVVLQEMWRDDPTWLDLCHVPGLVCDVQTGWLARTDPVATRKALLSWLAHCPLEVWWPCASFVAAVKAADPDFQRPDGDYDSWYIRDPASDAYLSGFESWDQVEGALIADLLAGPLHWLGVVDHSRSSPLPEGDFGPLCRLTASGAHWLGLAAGEMQAPQPAPITVGPDLLVDVPASASLYVRFQLERFADLEQAEPCHYRLTASGLSRALARGIQVEQVLAFLKRAGQRPVPPSVAGQIRQWVRRPGRRSP